MKNLRFSSKASEKSEAFFLSWSKFLAKTFFSFVYLKYEDLSFTVKYDNGEELINDIDLQDVGRRAMYMLGDLGKGELAKKTYRIESQYTKRDSTKE